MNKSDQNKDFNEKLAKLGEALNFKHVEPSIVQPAQLFFDLLSDDLRRRIFMVSEAMNSSESQLALRPEFTIAIAQDYLSNLTSADQDQTARLSYSGPVFRADPKSGACDQVMQTGIEIFGQEDTLKADIEVIEYALNVMAQSKVNGTKLVLGDYSLFYAILDQLNISKGWIKKIKRAFLSKNNLDELLALLKTPLKPSMSQERADFVEMIGNVEPSKAEKMVESLLSLNGLDAIAGRNVEEIAARFLEQAEDMASPEMSDDHIQIIEDYFKISDTASSAIKSLKTFAKKHNLKLDDEINRIEKLVSGVSDLNIEGYDAQNIIFNSFLGRSFEYYTGLVFEVVDAQSRTKAPLIGGGRYDELVNHLNDQYSISAVGASLWNERICELMDGDQA